MATIRYHTARTPFSPEEYALEDEQFKGILVRREKDLYRDQQEVGEVLRLFYYNPVEHTTSELFQAEIYFKRLESDAFFERGLVSRIKKRKFDSYVRGIVLSRTASNRHEEIVLFSPEEMPRIRAAVAFQIAERSSFAEYRRERSIGDTFIYSSPGSEKAERLPHTLEIEKSLQPSDHEIGVEYEYWRTKNVTTRKEDFGETSTNTSYGPYELVALRERTGSGLKISITRKIITLANHGEQFQLQSKTLSALELVMDFYERSRDKGDHLSVVS